MPQIPEQMVAAQLEPLAKRIEAYNAAVAILDDESSASPFKEWVKNTPEEIVLINDVVKFVETDTSFSPGQLKGMLTVLKTMNDKVVDMLETHYFATLPIKGTTVDENELVQEYEALRTEWKQVKSLIDSQWVTQELVDKYLPIEYKKLGRATEAKPHLNIAKPPTQQMRSNSKQMRLYVDGTLVEAENLSKAVLEGLNTDWKDFREAIGGDYHPGKVHEFKGKKIEIRWHPKS